MVPIMSELRAGPFRVLIESQPKLARKILPAHTRIWFHDVDEARSRGMLQRQFALIV